MISYEPLFKNHERKENHFHKAQKGRLQPRYHYSISREQYHQHGQPALPDF